MVDVETERKAPAPGLKEKDEEDISGIGTEEEEEEERLLDRVVCSRLQSQWARNLCALSTGRAPDESLGKARRGGEGLPDAEMVKMGRDGTYPCVQGRRKRRQRRGLRAGNPGSEALRRGPVLLQQ